MSNRKRINVTINPLHYDELQRICKAYKFANVCEICTALLSSFIQHVNKAESETARRKRRTESSEETIARMFADFENWEPTPDPSIMYKRHNNRRAADADQDTDGKPDTSGKQEGPDDDTGGRGYVDIFDYAASIDGRDENDDE